MGRGICINTQFGFRKNRRTTDCIFIFNTVIEHYKGKQVPLYVCYVDLKKAFDSVLLWVKLAQLGISKHLLTLLQLCMLMQSHV